MWLPDACALAVLSVPFHPFSSWLSFYSSFLLNCAFWYHSVSDEMRCDAIWSVILDAVAPHYSTTAFLDSNQPIDQTWCRVCLCVLPVDAMIFNPLWHLRYVEYDIVGTQVSRFISIGLSVVDLQVNNNIPDNDRRVWKWYWTSEWNTFNCTRC